MTDPYDSRSRERWVGEDPATKRADRDDFARDRARLLHSAALRRLSQKTQMHQPTGDDFVRNRLTHSLEVAQIGREFGAALGCSADVVDTACLAHDLGHPPFGHNGETALNELAAGIGGFEGNAQTLRLLTRLEAKRAHPDGRSAGLNLTRASLDASIKYPWRRGESPWPTVKFGVYDDDAPVFEWVREGVPADAPTRLCVEAQVMDWSDDVAYSVHDVEDAVAAGLVDLRALRSREVTEEVASVTQRLYAPDLDVAMLADALTRVLTAGGMPADHDGTRTSLAALKDTTSRLIGHFVHTVETATRDRHGDGPLTRHGAEVVVPDEVRGECAVLKGVAARFVLMTEDRQQLHAEQREMVGSLFRAYGDRPERLDPLYAADFAAAEGDAARLRVITDQIASLTDGRAITLARTWS
ncbi:deoxyguanosinetriphosphate triphosphohydrolase [Luteipulveratus flavus]|uniref:Deoxyguanosinetriphosphate triphosphohydrolase n=1 Tax=Luteipulveratus flavus TaxID=3031728 RepID=A0ABT6C376_9MICO|nr:deoxyguanosinetriphosphate triphosphohydrolase [Luteipulveratus sp. YIM 133296]MDF8263399.1 deoxyguanosinetriphosphate triphosphohydrolase [Luteipulveratus sp. YIM 133296]